MWYHKLWFRVIVTYKTMRTVILFFLFVQAAMATPAPLGLPWGEKVNPHFQVLEGYRYEYGDVTWGRIYFTGRMQDALETELALIFTTDHRIREASLILGPTGVTESNCVLRYKEVLRALDAKYGRHKYSKVIKESIMDELLFVSECYAIAVGVAEMETKWRFGNFVITASIYGYQRDVLIEVEYIYLPLVKERKKGELFKYL